MLGTVTGNMLQGAVQTVHHPHRQNQIKKLHAPIAVSGRDGKGHQGAGPGAAADLNPGLAQFSGNFRQKSVGDFLMHQQTLQGVADAGPLHLGVHDDVDGHVIIRGVIDKDMTDALVVFEHRDAGIFRDKTDQPLAAAGNDQVNLFFQAQHEGDGGAVRHRNHLDGRGIDILRRQGVLQHSGQGQVRVDGLGTAAQQNAVARLQTQGRRINRDIGPGLVDHADHPEGDAHAAHHDAVRPPDHLRHLAHRIRQGRNLLQAADHGGHRLVGEIEPVQHGA